MEKTVQAGNLFGVYNPVALKIEQNISLKHLNTFRVEVYAKYFTEIFTSDELVELIKSPSLRDQKKLVLGEGSDILFTKDFDGLVIKDCMKGIEKVHENDDYVWIRASSGENWHSFVEYCMGQNWGGLENLALIPGNVGAAPIQNIGAYGAELKDSFHSLEFVDLESAKTKIMMKDECKFGYRYSTFKEKNLRNRIYITSVTFRLCKSPQININYQDLQNEIKTSQAAIKDVFDAVVAIRRRKLPDPELIGNAGSFFKNPIVSMEEFQSLKMKYPDIKGFISGNEVKLAAAQLIESCGWKNIRRGDVAVHPAQALVIVNYGNATGREIEEYAAEIRESVFEKYGIHLEAEVNII